MDCVVLVPVGSFFWMSSSWRGFDGGAFDKKIWMGEGKVVKKFRGRFDVGENGEIVKFSRDSTK